MIAASPIRSEASPDALSSVESRSRWVACAAGLCAVHCVVSPLLATAAPFLAVGETAEWYFLAATFGLAMGLIAIGPKVGRLPVVGLVVAGGVVWATSLLGGFEPIPEWVTSPLGSLLIAGGMLWSAGLCRRGACAAGDD